jgi:hypothetical protein
MSMPPSRSSAALAGFAALRGRQVGLHIFDAFYGILDRAGGGDHTGSAGQEAFDGGAAQAFGATADENALAGELGGIGLDVHTVVSSVLMAPRSSVKR